MKIKRLVLGPLETNCYLIINDQDCIIIDPAADAHKIVDAVGSLEVKTILVTHHHFDHIGALQDLLDYYKVKENDFKCVDNMEVIDTKGHTSDSYTFYFPKDNAMFCGDFLFKDSFGRTDLSGNPKDMINSLDLIEKYSENTVIYPGHGPKTTLKEEMPNFDNYRLFLKKLDK